MNKNSKLKENLVKINEAKIVKLKTLANLNLKSSSKCCKTERTERNRQDDSIDSSIDIYISDEAEDSIDKTKFHENTDVVGEFLTKLYIVSDFKSGDFYYGDLQVTRGENVYLICESENFYFVENKHGEQGFIPNDICVDLNEVQDRLKYKSKCKYLEHKITSL